MALNDISLGLTGSEILLNPLARTFSEGLLEFSRKERTASARLVTDIRAIKKSFALVYSFISHEDVEQMATLYELKAELSLLVARPDSTVDDYAVILQPFRKKRARSVGMKYWSDVQFDMEEV